MATPRTGKPRGRPPKPKDLKGPRGRRRTPFLSFPDRYVLALADSVKVAMGERTKSAIRMVVGESVIEHFIPENKAEQKIYNELVKDLKPGCFKAAYHWRHDGVTLDGEDIDAKPSCSWQSVESRVQYLMKKRREYEKTCDKNAKKWHVKMCAAFAVPLGRKFPNIDHSNIAAAKHFALWKAKEVGEEAVALRCIHPMIDRAAGNWLGTPPDFSLIFGSDL